MEQTPTPPSPVAGVGATDLNLLDYFAGQAMVAELTLQDAGEHFGEYDERTAPVLAKKCYMLAAAMLAARPA